MIRSFKIIVEKHEDGYVAYPLGLKGLSWTRAIAMRGQYPTMVHRHL